MTSRPLEMIGADAPTCVDGVCEVPSSDVADHEGSAAENPDG
jgi:hypothetical protein